MTFLAALAKYDWRGSSMRLLQMCMAMRRHEYFKRVPHDVQHSQMRKLSFFRDACDWGGVPLPRNAHRALATRIFNGGGAEECGKLPRALTYIDMYAYVCIFIFAYLYLSG